MTQADSRPDSIPSHSTRDTWWIKVTLRRILFAYFSPVRSVPAMFHTHRLNLSPVRYNLDSVVK